MANHSITELQYVSVLAHFFQPTFPAARFVIDTVRIPDFPQPGYEIILFLPSYFSPELHQATTGNQWFSDTQGRNGVANMRADCANWCVKRDGN